MARYLFSAQNAKGKAVDSFIEAPSATLALALLREKSTLIFAFIHPKKAPSNSRLRNLEIKPAPATLCRTLHP